MIVPEVARCGAQFEWYRESDDPSQSETGRFFLQREPPDDE